MLSSVAEEMGAVLIKAAYSPNIKERRDLSCAIFNATGEMAAQASHIPVHLGSMSFAVKAVIGMEINDGDILCLNDPYRGGTHLPDITVIAPVFINNKLEFFVASRAHHADVGGITPGSMPLSQSIEEEGVIIPPSKLYSRNKKNTVLFKRIVNHSRDSEESEGDFHAQVGAVRLGVKRMKDIIAKYSLNKIKKVSEELLNYSERIMKDVISSIPDGNYHNTEYMDDDGFGSKNIHLDLNLKIEGNKVRLDFTGSANSVRGCLNCPLSVTTSAVLYVFQCLAPRELPLNSGSLRPLIIITKMGSILNSQYPSAVAGGNVETSQRVVDLVFGALEKAVPDRIPASSAGTMSNITFGGVLPDGNKFAYYETIAGGMGGRKGMQGISAIQTHMTNTLNTPVEALERELPIIIMNYSIRKNSGGKGRYRGGDGLKRTYKFLVPSQATLITERRRISPRGAAGGRNGKKGINFLISDARRFKLPAKVTLNLNANDMIEIHTPGGGAWGI